MWLGESQESVHQFISSEALLRPVRPDLFESSGTPSEAATKRTTCLAVGIFLEGLLAHLLRKVVRPPWHPPQPSSQEVGGPGALGIADDSSNGPCDPLPISGSVWCS